MKGGVLTFRQSSQPADNSLKDASVLMCPQVSFGPLSVCLCAQLVPELSRLLAAVPVFVAFADVVSVRINQKLSLFFQWDVSLSCPSDSSRRNNKQR